MTFVYFQRIWLKNYFDKAILSSWNEHMMLRSIGMTDKWTDGWTNEQMNNANTRVASWLSFLSSKEVPVIFQKDFVDDFFLNSQFLVPANWEIDIGITSNLISIQWASIR